MRFIYSMLMYLLTPYLFLRLWLKGRSLPAYKQRISERFAFDTKALKPVDIWLHAVSLGEVIAATPLIDAFLQQNKTLMVTTMTPTGSARVLERFGDQVAHQYIPYDLPCALRRFFKAIQPKVGVIMETELWPNMIYEATHAHIPLFLANARLSEKSFRGYMKLRWFFKPMLQRFRLIMVQSSDDAQRFIGLGAPTDRVAVLGNVKFDMQTQGVDSQMFLDLKKRWGVDRTVVMIASTHDPEESLFLEELDSLMQAIPNTILLIAPRHPERFQAVYKQAVERGFNTGLRSRSETISEHNQLVVLDSLGELLGWYSVSDYAFVGGSLLPVGGHNLLEPIAMNVPSFTGPMVHNFKAICEALIEAKAIVMVDDVRAFVEEVQQLESDKAKRQLMVERATRVLEENKGAVARHVEKIAGVLG